MDYLEGEIIPGDKLFTMPSATSYEFGILMSNVHMAWTRAVCGRLKSDYSYSNMIVYNNFPWPSPRLTKNPEIKYAGKDNDMAVARYTLAVNRKYKRDGEQEADFISCVTFGKSAEFAQKYLHKGMRIVIGGRISTGSYKDKDGKTIYTTDVIVEEHEFAQNKDSGAGADSSETPKTDKDGFMEAKDGENPFD